MKIIYKTITLIVVIISSVNFNAHSQDNLIQDYEIYPKDNKYIVRGKIDLKHHLSEENASVAIQFALNNLEKSGGTVYLHSGIYKLNKEINILSHTTLTGSGSGTRLVFDDNHDTGIAINCKAADNTVVKNLSILAEQSNTSARIGVQIDNSGLTNVENISCIGMQEHGIVLANNSFLCNIDACKIGGVGKSGILVKNLFKGGRGGDWVPSRVSNCTVFASGKGIEIDKSPVINISDCQIYQTKSHGFHIHSESNAVHITGCRTYQISGNSVVVEKSNEINISSNTFSWSTQEGIILDHVKWGLGTGNNVIDNGSVNLFDPEEDPFIKEDPRRPWLKKSKSVDEIKNCSGIILRNETMGIAVTGNSFFNWHIVPPMKHGIEEDQSCFSNNISSNNINFCKDEGVSSKGKETLVSDNKIYAEVPFFKVNSNKPFTNEIIKDYQFFDTRLIRQFIEEIKQGL